MDIETQKMTQLVLQYIYANRPEIQQDVNSLELVTSAFIAGYKSAHGYVTVEGDISAKL